MRHREKPSISRLREFVILRFDQQESNKKTSRRREQLTRHKGGQEVRGGHRLEPERRFAGKKTQNCYFPRICYLSVIPALLKLKERDFGFTAGS